MREDWVECTFEDVFELITNGSSIKQTDDINGIPVSRIETIWNETIDWSRVKYAIDYDDTVHNKYLLKNGDILFSHINSDSHLGKTAIFKDSRKLLHGINLLLLRPYSILNSTYILYYLRFTKYRGGFLQIAQRSVNQSSINQRSLKQLKISLPPFPEQRAIVKKIEALFSSLDVGIADLKKAQDQLKIYRQAVLKKAFEGELTKEWREKQTDLHTAEELLVQIEEKRQAYYEKQIEDWKEAVSIWEKNGKEGMKPKKLAKIDLSKNDFIDSDNLPNSWKLVQISDILKFLTDYHANGGYETLRDNVELLDGEGYALMIRATNFEKNDFKKDVKFISEQAYNFLNKTKLYGGEILFGKIGNAGKSYLMPHLNRPCSLAMNLFSLTTYINNKYLSYHLKNNKQVQEVNSYVKGVGNPTIDKKSIRSIHISLCSLEEQAQIVKEIEARLSVCDAVEQQIKDSLSQAEALRQSILKKAFEGKLLSEEEIKACQQEADYEPAAVLLEKIKAEKEANKPQKKTKKK